jgi:molecular chaperone GrpE
MAETHHDRTKVPPREGAGDRDGSGTEGEGDAQIRPSPPNVERAQPPAEEILGDDDAEGVDSDDDSDDNEDDLLKGSRKRGAAGELERLERELADFQDRHLRLAAEFDNYRRRIERERAELPQRARAEVVSRLLDVLDDVQRVAAFADDSPAPALLEGVRLVEKKMRGLVEGWGLVAVDPAGELFDPATMEAMMTVPAEHPEEDDVVFDVFQKGYRLGDSLIRPARVRVKKYEG